MPIEMPHTHVLSNRLALEDLAPFLLGSARLELSAEAVARIAKGRTYLEQAIGRAEKPIYGINTGFGSLCDVMIPPEDLEQLQANLVMSHACGTGPEVPAEIVRLMLVLKVQSLSYGHSGVQVATVQRLVDMLNANLLPVVFQQGSLGASGDLAPLAHLCLPLLGLGDVHYNGQRMPAATALQQLQWPPLRLGAKEGLALLNGTQFMSAYGAYCLLQARQIAHVAHTAAALSIDAFGCRIDPFHPLIHAIRPHKGQVQAAATMRTLLSDSPLAATPKAQVQDPYSFRCIPQVHGASLDALGYAETVFHTEMNAVSDNPNVFPDEDLILSGGNFHGQPLAIALDLMAIALSEFGAISERRTYLLISGQRGLPPFLVAQPGLNSGLMIPQYTAAALASQNKQLCTPASADSITSSNGQEDHVSMGANAATKLYQVVHNVFNILAIEWMTAAQALEFRRPAQTAPAQEALIATYRTHVPPLDRDRTLQPDIAATKVFLMGKATGGTPGLLRPAV